MKDELLPLSEMIFTGPVTVGGPNVTLHGDASSIYEQILAINPEFDASAFEGPASGSSEGSLEARQVSFVSVFSVLGTRFRLGSGTLFSLVLYSVDNSRLEPPC